MEAGKTFWGEKKEVSREAEGAAIKEWLSTLVVTPSPTPPPRIPEREESISETFVRMIYSRSFNIIFYVVTSQSSLQQSHNSGPFCLLKIEFLFIWSISCLQLCLQSESAEPSEASECLLTMITVFEITPADFWLVGGSNLHPDSY